MEFLCTLEEGLEKAIKRAEEKYTIKGEKYPFTIELYEKKGKAGALTNTFFISFDNEHAPYSTLDISIDSFVSLEDVENEGYYSDFFFSTSKNEDKDTYSSTIITDDCSISITDYQRWIENLELSIILNKRERKIKEAIKKIDEELGIKIKDIKYKYNTEVIKPIESFERPKINFSGLRNVMKIKNEIDKEENKYNREKYGKMFSTKK